MTALCSHRVTLSLTALNCLLCISACLAAFIPDRAPLFLNDRSRCQLSLSSSDAAFASLGSSRLRHRDVLSPIPRRGTISLASNSNYDGRRRHVFFERRATASDSDGSGIDTADIIDDGADDDGDERIKGGIRARVRQRVTKASKKVQNLVSPASYLSSFSSSRVREVVSTGVVKGGSPIAGVLTDAALNAAELAAEEVRAAALDVLQRSRSRNNGSGGAAQSSSSILLEAQALNEADAQVTMDAILLAKTSVADAFVAAEDALAMAEKEIRRARAELEVAKRDATLGLAVAERAAAEAALKARMATESTVRDVASSMEEMGSLDDEGSVEEAGSVVEAEASNDAEVPKTASEVSNEDDDVSKMESTEDLEVKESQLESHVEVTMIEPPKSVGELGEAEAEEEGTDDSEDILSGKWSGFDETDLSYEDVDYTLTDMAPPFINENECLVPGEPVVRVEKAPQNSRRIFAGIDIPVSVDDVWEMLTDYPNLQKVVPNLVVNEVLQLYHGADNTITTTMDDDASDADQCKTLADRMKGAVLKQVGGAKVVGINFSARTTLEVREWPAGMPDFAHFEDEVYEGKSRSTRVKESRKRDLMRYAFPRPFALSSLPHKDISMQSVEEDDGEFRMYQGVWRMQPLPGCSPADGSAMRLTYAVEVSPRPYLPVALVEGRIAQDLCANLKAIRDIFAARASAEEV